MGVSGGNINKTAIYKDKWHIDSDFPEEIMTRPLHLLHTAIPSKLFNILNVGENFSPVTRADSNKSRDSKLQDAIAAVELIKLIRMPAQEGTDWFVKKDKTKSTIGVADIFTKSKSSNDGYTDKAKIYGKRFVYLQNLAQSLELQVSRAWRTRKFDNANSDSKAPVSSSTAAILPTIPTQEQSVNINEFASDSNLFRLRLTFWICLLHAPLQGQDEDSILGLFDTRIPERLNMFREYRSEKYKENPSQRAEIRSKFEQLWQDEVITKLVKPGLEEFQERINRSTESSEKAKTEAVFLPSLRNEPTLNSQGLVALPSIAFDLTEQKYGRKSQTGFFFPRLWNLFGLNADSHLTSETDATKHDPALSITSAGTSLGASESHSNHLEETDLCADDHDLSGVSDANRVSASRCLLARFQAPSEIAGVKIFDTLMRNLAAKPQSSLTVEGLSARTWRAELQNYVSILKTNEAHLSKAILRLANTPSFFYANFERKTEIGKNIGSSSRGTNNISQYSLRAVASQTAGETAQLSLDQILDYLQEDSSQGEESPALKPFLFMCFYL